MDGFGSLAKVVDVNEISIQVRVFGATDREESSVVLNPLLIAEQEGCGRITLHMVLCKLLEEEAQRYFDGRCNRVWPSAGLLLTFRAYSQVKRIYV